MEANIIGCLTLRVINSQYHQTNSISPNVEIVDGVFHCFSGHKDECAIVLYCMRTVSGLIGRLGIRTRVHVEVDTSFQKKCNERSLHYYDVMPRKEVHLFSFKGEPRKEVGSEIT